MSNTKRRFKTKRSILRLHKTSCRSTRARTRKIKLRCSWKSRTIFWGCLESQRLNSCRLLGIRSGCGKEGRTLISCFRCCLANCSPRHNLSAIRRSKISTNLDTRLLSSLEKCVISHLTRLHILMRNLISFKSTSPCCSRSVKLCSWLWTNHLSFSSNLRTWNLNNTAKSWLIRTLCGSDAPHSALKLTR